MGVSGMAMPQIPTVSMEQALINLIQAIAMQEAAIASIFNAEAAMIDAMIAAGFPAAAEIAEVNALQSQIKEILAVLCQRQEASMERIQLVMALLQAQH
jgi:hypothetical protein